MAPGVDASALTQQIYFINNNNDLISSIANWAQITSLAVSPLALGDVEGLFVLGLSFFLANISQNGTQPDNEVLNELYNKQLDVEFFIQGSTQQMEIENVWQHMHDVGLDITTIYSNSSPYADIILGQRAAV